MNHMLCGHGYPPETLERAAHVYACAWRWRAANHVIWSAIVQAAEAQAVNNRRIVVRRLTAGLAPQRFAPIMARWLASEHPSLLPRIETRRSVFDCFTGATHGRA